MPFHNLRMAPPAIPIPRPTLADLRRARRLRLPDVIAPGIRVLFCGINPGLYSAAVGHHFGRPGNRFWKALHASGFTDRLYSPDEDLDLPTLGLGITNLCPRTTARAEELSGAELARGARALAAKAARYRPRVIAVLGVGA
jgi:TDG/mug DNA glycosylase family protein